MPLSTRLARDRYVESHELFEIRHEPPRVTEAPPKEIVNEIDPIEEARQKAQEMLAKAAKKAEELKAEAQQRGYAEGLEKGRLEAQAIIEQARQHSQRLLAELEGYRVNTLQQLTEEIRDLVFEIAEKILKTELQQESDLTTSLVKTAINEVSSRQKVHIFINPRDLARVEQEKDFLNTKLERASVELLMDPSIELGGCRILTEKGWVDATIDNQLKELKELLLTETA